jgi:site-specific recombinase XerD
MPTNNLKPIKFSDALELFLLDCKSRRLTKTTIAFYESRLRKFSDWLSTDELPDANTVKRFQVSVQNYSDHYQHGLARAIKTFLTYCYEDDLSPLVKFSMPRLEKKVLPAFTKEEVKAILAACKSERDTAIIYTLLDTGIRASELCALTVGDFDSAGTLHVRLGKGQKGRVIPIGSKASRVIKRYLMNREVTATDPLFPSNRNKHLRPDGLVQVMDRLRERTNIDHCTAHTFRRTFAITCLRNGMNIHVLAKCMGHSDIQVLRQYLDLLDSDLQEAHKLASPVDNM